MAKVYHIGEIQRLGLLKARDGKPYRSKVTISKLVNMLDYYDVGTHNGKGKGLDTEQIEKLNKRFE